MHACSMQSVGEGNERGSSLSDRISSLFCFSLFLIFAGDFTARLLVTLKAQLANYILVYLLIVTTGKMHSLYIRLQASGFLHKPQSSINTELISMCHLKMKIVNIILREIFFVRDSDLFWQCHWLLSQKRLWLLYYTNKLCLYWNEEHLIKLKK